MAVQVAQRVPLHEREAQGRQRLVQGAVVAVLQALHGQGYVGGAVGHGGELTRVNQVAYIR